ncbi:flavin-containing amine oxidoreductase-domain containing protein [Aspergillus welwitschiae]|uniref:Flavin-containing amine oxidoreductase-domain containing protein n=1 Tax=Aspergillus welwitschiae TaxID=1341132 RepID=A0A3F3PVC1_9EURO|nr:flavin-containing amine oxidoreductase-domain containing protein [Aspergillus welwitschiae]RDH30877.1 flavin-containing amine oxidoreductase-domain containing protein [Aspergillus welwitschiae]
MSRYNWWYSPLVLGVIYSALVGAVSQHPPREVHRHVLNFQVPSLVTADSLHNVHLDFLDSSFEGHINLFYGDCNTGQGHHEIGHIVIKRDAHPERFVWITPADAPHLHCLHAISGSTLLARSDPIPIATRLARRESIADVADVLGPWFDGVAYMQGKEPGKAVVSAAKNSSVAIIGGGISGMMTSLLLNSVGMTNWHIVESSHRLGGRIRTHYLNDSRPDQYQYQELGAMRFPMNITYADTNETLQIQDMRLVLQLADVLNELNADADPELRVNFIPFIQDNPNLPTDTGGVRLPDGRIPTVAQVAANSSLAYTAPPDNASAVADAKAGYMQYAQTDKISNIREVARNMYRAHKAALEDGFYHWSEAAYMRYALGENADVVDYAAGTANNPIWDGFYDSVYFAATTWFTIDQGMESLVRAFLPHVADKATLGRKVDGLSYNESSGKIAYTWRDSPVQITPERSEEYDYAVVAAPFTKVRMWELPRYSSILSRAISETNYEPACKLALLYKTRFWEHQEQPIFGGCGTVDIPGVQYVCYPSFNLNGTGPAAVLGAYSLGGTARSVQALKLEDYVALARRSMVEIHGAIAEEQFTGISHGHCWENDEHQNGAWTHPLVGQQQVFLPAYYQTEFQTIFVGEHTSYTHGWIAAALDSAVRGTTQLLLDLGLVDEAKAIVHEWMGRWIEL